MDVKNFEFTNNYFDTTGTFTMYPKKAGQTTLTFANDSFWYTGGCKFTVKVKIEPEAVINEKNYPKLKIETLAADDQAMMGQPVSLNGQCTQTTSDSKYHYYHFATADKSPRAFIVAVPVSFKEVQFSDGKAHNIFGHVHQLSTETTETGLSLVTPTILADRIDDEFFLTEIVDIDLSEKE